MRNIAIAAAMTATLLIGAVAVRADDVNVNIGGIRPVRAVLCDGPLSYNTMNHTFSCDGGTSGGGSGDSIDGGLTLDEWKRAMWIIPGGKRYGAAWYVFGSNTVACWGPALQISSGGCILAALGGTQTCTELNYDKCLIDGVAFLSLNTTTTVGNTVGLVSTTSQHSGPDFATRPIIRWKIQTVDNLIGVRQIVGFSSNATTALCTTPWPIDTLGHAAFIYDHGQGHVNWMACNSRQAGGSVQKCRDTGIPVVAGAVHDFMIDWTGYPTTLKYYIDGTLVATAADPEESMPVGLSGSTTQNLEWVSCIANQTAETHTYRWGGFGIETF